MRLFGTMFPPTTVVLVENSVHVLPHKAILSAETSMHVIMKLSVHVIPQTPVHMPLQIPVLMVNVLCVYFSFCPTSMVYRRRHIIPQMEYSDRINGWQNLRAKDKGIRLWE